MKRLLIGAGLTVAVLMVSYVGLLAAGFFAVKYHLTDVPGVVDPHSDDFAQLARTLDTIPPERQHLPSVSNRNESTNESYAAQDRCQLDIVRQVYPINADWIAAALSAGASHEVFAKMVFALRLRETAGGAFATALDQCASNPTGKQAGGLVRHTENAFPWARREECHIAQAAFTKDASDITSAATVTGVEARMIVAAGFVEQMRLYFTERELYEKFFRPLKILGNATKFAWGVMAIKEAAAIDVEDHLRDRRSVFYLGRGVEHVLDFSGLDRGQERLARLTDEKNHLFSYLYGGLALAQFRAQWRRAGYPIDRRPEVLATLYNIGFGRSKPNDHPQVGGSTITIADTNYTFGALAFEYYYSGEMLDIFPYLEPSS